MDETRLRQLETLLRTELQAIAFSDTLKETQSVEVSFYLTPSEKAKLNETCQGIGISKFIRALLLRSRPLTPRPIVPQVNREVYIELSRLGRNLNQQTRVLHEALQNVPDQQTLERSIVPAYLAQLEALKVLLLELRQSLVPNHRDADDEL